MTPGDLAQWAEAARNELLLFATLGFLLGGFDDLLVDLVWVFLSVKQRIAQSAPMHDPLADAEAQEPMRRIAVFVPAWQEEDVIGDMLRTALSRWDSAQFVIFVGCYQNDPATIAAARAVAHAQVRVPDTAVQGPTTKAECLNRLYQAMTLEASTTGQAFDAVLLHDAEDLVHPKELWLFSRLIGRFGLIQLPVLPLPTQGSLWISGHYLDEFAQAHSRDLVVRGAVGASIPAAGVGCAIATPVLAALARRQNGRPFAEDSLTEDYELGLKLNAMGIPTAFVRWMMDGTTDLIATRAHFPDKLGDAVRQKARWTAGIALAGWDRLGWSASWRDNWMRWRDRRALYAACVISSGYAALLLSVALGIGTGHFGGLPKLLTPLLEITGLLLIWRLTVRAFCVSRHYGWRAGLTSIPRTLISNIVAMLAARAAMMHYISFLRTGVLAWQKTSHRSPLAP